MKIIYYYLLFTIIYYLLHTFTSNPEENVFTDFFSPVKHNCSILSNPTTHPPNLPIKQLS